VKGSSSGRASRRALGVLGALLLGLCFALPGGAAANPWNGKMVFQAFWWDCWNERYPGDWYTYLAKLMPRLRAMGFDGLWIPSPVKGDAGSFSMGYDPFDHYDLGEKDQKGTVATRFARNGALAQGPLELPPQSRQLVHGRRLVRGLVRTRHMLRHA
jgi:hypothetical protein